MRRIKREADRAENNDSTDEKSQLKTGRTELEFLSAYEIEPAYSGDQANETTRRDPRLRRESGRERDRKIVDHRAPRGPVAGCLLMLLGSAAQVRGGVAR